jgi:hypothetical protein
VGVAVRQKAARRRHAEAREVARVKADLDEIYALSKYIRDADHLRTLLAGLPAGETRTQVAALLAKFVPFDVTGAS